MNSRFRQASFSVSVCGTQGIIRSSACLYLVIVVLILVGREILGLLCVYFDFEFINLDSEIQIVSFFPVALVNCTGNY
jgi:hypothetical protein